MVATEELLVTPVPGSVPVRVPQTDPPSLLTAARIRSSNAARYSVSLHQRMPRPTDPLRIDFVQRHPEYVHGPLRSVQHLGDAARVPGCRCLNSSGLETGVGAILRQEAARANDRTIPRRANSRPQWAPRPARPAPCRIVSSAVECNTTTAGRRRFRLRGIIR